jgi:hypothetical protein
MASVLRFSLKAESASVALSMLLICSSSSIYFESALVRFDLENEETHNTTLYLTYYLRLRLSSSFRN